MGIDINKEHSRFDKNLFSNVLQVQRIKIKRFVQHYICSIFLTQKDTFLWNIESAYDK